MTHSYRLPELPQSRAEMRRDVSDGLRDVPALRRAGLDARNAAADELVQALLSVERDSEGAK